jgi:WD40 repeat protein
MRPNQQREERHRMLAGLLRPEGGWVDICRSAVAEGDPASLATHQSYWEAFAADRRHLLAPTTNDLPVSATATARATLDIARALSLDGNNESIRQALETFNRCGLTSPSAPHEHHAPRTNSPLDRVLHEIEILRPGNPSADFAVLLARYLAGQDNRLVRKVEIPVLFDRTTAGSVGYLIVKEIADGPAGLHPAPESMSFLTVDEPFQRAIANAWALVPKTTTKRSFIWEIRDAASGEPVREVAGGSLALAWFVALDSFRLGKAATLLRPKKLDPQCAVTGELEDARPASVEGYENKFKAAEEHGLRIVYPAVDRETAEPIAARLAATATPANDLSNTVRAVRTRPNPTARLIVAAMAAVLIGILATGAALGGQIQRSAIASDVQSLINQSQSQHGTDPRKAALYALAADKLGSSGETRDNVFKVAAENSNIAASLTAADEAIRVIEGNSSGDGLYVVAGDSKIIRIDTEHKTETWRFHADSRVEDLAVSPDGKILAVLDERTIKTYDLSFGAPTLSRIILQDAGQIRDQLRVYVIAPSHTSSSTYNVLAISKKSATVFSETGRTLESVQLINENETVTTAGNDADYLFGRYSIVLSSSLGRVLELRTGPLEVSEIGPKGTLSGTVNSMDSHPGAEILAGTDKGLYSVSRMSKAAVFVPSAGVGTAENIMITEDDQAFDGGVAVITTNGLTVAPIFDWSTLSFELARTGDRHLTSMDAAGGYLAIGDIGGRITFIRPGPRAVGEGIKGTVASAVAFSPDGSLFAADASNSTMAISTIERANLADGGASSIPNEPDAYRIEPTAEPIYVNNIDAGTEYLAAAGQSGSDREKQGVIVVWKRGQPQPAQTINFSGKEQDRLFRTDAPDIVSRVELLEDKNLLVAYNLKSGRIAVFRLPDMTPITSKAVGSANRAFGLARDEASLFHLSGSSFTSNGHDMTLQMLSATDLSVQWTVPVPNAVAATPLAGKKAIAVLEDAQTLVLRSDSDGNVVQTIKLEAPTRDIIGSRDGNLLAAIQQNGTVKILSTTDFKPTAPPLFDQRNRVAVHGAWSPDGQSFVRTGVAYRDVGKPEALMYVLWDLSSDIWASYLCTVAGTDLTDAEWKSLQLNSPRPALCPTQN